MHLVRFGFLVLVLSLSLSPFALAAQDDIPFIEFIECPFEPAEDVPPEAYECGQLHTWEDYANPDGQVITIPFVLLYSQSDDPEPDPVIYLSGGPGGSASSEFDTWAASPILAARSLILVDQRGTGYSTPSLNCIEAETLEEGSDELIAVGDCYERLLSQGVNVSAYNSANSAADLFTLQERLSEEFGFDSFNLYGVSYGTRLALTMMRDYPAMIRSVVLDGVYPPNVNAYEKQALDNWHALQRLFAGCAAHPACGESYPDLEAVFYRAVDALNQDVGIYESEDPETGEIFEKELNGDGLVDFVIQGLYDTGLIPYLPQIIYEVADGNYAAVDTAALADGSHGRYLRQNDGEFDDEEDEEFFEDEFVDQAHTADDGSASGTVPVLPDGEGDISDAEGMFNSVECVEEIPFNDRGIAEASVAAIPESIREALSMSMLLVYDTCDIWIVDPGDPIETSAVSSELPTLVLNGEYDPITPPSSGELAAQTLVNSYLYTFPGTGHGVIDSGDCPNSIILQFLDNPLAEPDSSCIAEMAGPDFVVE